MHSIAIGALWVMPTHTGTEALALILRWFHFLAGITWVGLLYFFNLVNVPFMKQLDASMKPKVFQYMTMPALQIFRWSALLTVLFGFWYWGQILVGPDALREGKGMCSRSESEAAWESLCCLTCGESSGATTRRSFEERSPALHRPTARPSPARPFSHRELTCFFLCPCSSLWRLLLITGSWVSRKQAISAGLVLSREGASLKLLRAQVVTQ